ncbi:MAG TPA: SurA N-terminal domain-containing protein [Pyrinomonadaceae bacterium]|nr:SurA N-terminal domain-containing protein [Pyrinomonadaceae bacterium]
MLRKHKRNLSLMAVVLGALLIAACGSGSNTTPDNTVAATVNGTKIMLSEVERVIQQQMQGKQSELSAHDLAQARLTVLDNLIQREVLYQRAEQEKLLPTEEQITSAINQRKQQSGVTQEEFDRQLKESGMTNEELHETAKKDLAVTALGDKYAGKITISDREVEDYYNTNKSQFVNARGVTLAMIVADPADNGGRVAGPEGDAKNEADAKTKIDAIYQQLKAGADFAEVARVKSEDRTLLQGGDIGLATEDDLKSNGFPPEVVAQLFGPMQVGSFTSPVKFSSPQYPNGRWYIFKLKEKRLQTENLTLEGQYPEGETVRHRITTTLTNQRKETLNDALVRVALSEAKIVNNLAADILNNPSNVGLRPASSNAAKPSSSPAATTASPSPAAKASASPAKASSPAR